MKEALLTILRNKETKTAEFRAATQKIAEILAAEAALYVPLKEKPIETPICAFPGHSIAGPIILVPVLRAGLTLLPSFVALFSEARVGFIGIKREEESALPQLYYENIPKLSGQEDIFLLDPMIATGGTAKLAIRHLLYFGAKPEKITLFGIIASKPGIDAIVQSFPQVRLHVLAKDPHLNAAKFIVPGLGDFGDRFFGNR